MMKFLPVFTMIALLCAASMVGLPLFAPQVKANEPVAIQMPSRASAPDCSQQIWPNYQTSCLRSLVGGTAIQDARLVITHR